MGHPFVYRIGIMVGLGGMRDALRLWSRHLIFKKLEKDERDDIGSLNEYRTQQRFQVREIASTFWLFLIIQYSIYGYRNTLVSVMIVDKYSFIQAQ